MDWNAFKDAVAPKPVEVVIRLPYGRTLNVHLCTLTYVEWLSPAFDVPDPVVPRTLLGADGSKLPNRDDVAYQQELARVNAERGFRRLILALEKAGMQIPGADTEAKVEALETAMDSGAVTALIAWINQAALAGRASVDALAETFHAGADAGVGAAAGVSPDMVSVPGAASA